MKGLKRFLVLVLFGLLTLSIAGCNELNNVEPTGENVGSFTSYKQLRAYLDSNLNDSQNMYFYRDGDGTVNEAVTYADGLDATEDSTPDYSKTNNQVDGVEESDRILTDGYKIYILSGSKFLIVDAKTLNIDYTYTMEDGNLSNMYLYADKIVLIANVYHTYETTCSIDDYWGYRYIFGDETVDPDVTDDTDEDLTTTESVITEATTYVCYKYTYGTEITVLDVSNTEEVSVDRSLYLDASYIVDSRMIDEQLYLVLDNNMYYYGYNEDDYIPKYRDSVVSDELLQVPANHIYFIPNDQHSYSFLTLVSFDVTDSKACDIKSYLGSSYRIYMSENNLYTTVYRSTFDENTERWEYSTYILRFEIIDGKLVYKALASVNGYPLDQFSMDEYDGVFRIATTAYSYGIEEWTIVNSLFLFDATTTGEMKQISVLSGLGKPGERIYAVRYAEDIAYVVTFVQTDPLYKIDLSDPENPTVLGELYEDGVSDYLHIITDNLMLGIGRQAETVGGRTNFTGVKVALYDTSGDTPVALDTYLVPGEYSYTNVMWDHKAFLSFSPKDENFTYVGIPVYEYYRDFRASSQNLYLFKIYDSGDLEFVTKLTHMIKEGLSYYRYFDSIERAVIIDDYIYTVSYSSVQKIDMNNNFEVIKRTELNPSYYEHWGYPEEDITTESVN